MGAKGWPVLLFGDLSCPVLPSSSPSGCRLFSRWFHRAHPPSHGPLREKAAFCTDPGRGWQILVIWNLAPNVQTLVPLSGDREGPQNHSLWELGVPQRLRASPWGRRTSKGRQGGGGIASYKHPLGPGRLACRLRRLAARPRSGRRWEQ